MSRWWRAYDEAVDDPKLQRLKPASFKGWFNLMCLASANDGILPAIADIAFKLRLNVQSAAALVTELVSVGLVDQREDGSFEPHNWKGRQFKSDGDPTATDRKRRQRDKNRDTVKDVTRDVTKESRPPETEAETDTESSLRSDSAPKRTRAKPRVPLPELWQLEEQDFEYASQRGFPLDQIRSMAIAFANHHRGKGNLMADWHAAWRTWCENEIKFNANRGNGNGSAQIRPNSSITESLRRELAELERPESSDCQVLPGSVLRISDRSVR